jgi:CspA family cold shock protein
MTYRDMLVTCKECGKEFVFTVEKQRHMAEQGEEVVVPDLCDECQARLMYGGKHHGRVKWFDAGKGYGFIARDSGDEIFVHRTGITPDNEGKSPTLEEGQEVLYDVIDTSKGPQAVEVTPFEG